MDDYSRYYLSDNPFPETAVIDPLSSDIRVNGGIFHEGIFRKEIEDLRKKTGQGVNVIYLSGIEFDRGIGKSALMIHELQTLRGEEGSTCIYVKCDEKDKPRDAVRKVVEQWHCCGDLWRAFKAAFTEYSRSKGDPLLTPDAVERLFADFPTPPDKLPLSRYTHTRDSEKVAEVFAAWLATRVKTGNRVLLTLTSNYLSEPTEFLESIKGRSVDPIDLYEACLKFLDCFGYKRHYVFLDQFEDMVMGTSKASMGKFALEMKSIIRASAGKAILFVTLHPNSETSLKIPAAQDMLGVAPLDAIHRINVMILDTKGDSAISLAEEYFRRFRVGEAPYASYPVQPELLEFMGYMNRGLIRGFLQQLHNALDYGAGAGYPELTLEYAREHSLEVLGREVDQKLIDGFNKHKGKVTPPGPPIRSLGGLMKDFKEEDRK
jgi:hypothetical protein